MINKKHKQQGFTLLELLIVIGIVSIIAAFSTPSLKSFIDNSRIRASTHQLLSAFIYARNEASKLGQDVALCVSTNGSSCGNAGSSYAAGWIVFADIGQGGSSGNNQFDSGTETLLMVEDALPDGFTIEAPSSLSKIIKYNALGQIVGRTTSGFTLTLKKDGEAKRQLKFSSTGRVRVCTVGKDC